MPATAFFAVNLALLLHVTSTVAQPGSSRSATRATPITPAEKGSWWSNHWKWVIMVIIIALGLVAIALIGIFLKRRYHRKQDVSTSAFNPGITQRATPMTSIPPGKNYVYNMDGVGGSGRVTPAPYNEYGYARGDTRQASQSYLPRVREKDRATVVREEPVPAHGERMAEERVGSPLAATDRPMGKLTKGKGRM